MCPTRWSSGRATSSPARWSPSSRKGEVSRARTAAHYASSAKPVTANPVDAMLWDEARRVEAEYLEKKGGVERIGPIREEMQLEMDAGAGVFRTKESLSRLARNLGGLRERFEKVKVDDSSRTFNTEITAALELDFMLEVASSIT